VSSEAIVKNSNFKVNDDETGAMQKLPRVATDQNGGMLVVWEDQRRGDLKNASDIYVKKFSNNGTIMFGDLKVNDNSELIPQKFPDVSATLSGASVVVWQDTRDAQNIYGQRIDQNGSPQGENFKVNRYQGLSVNTNPSCAMDRLGRFVVVWCGVESGIRNVYAQLFSLGGQPMDSSFKVNDDAQAVDHHYPRVAMDWWGNFVVAWYDRRDAQERIFLQMCDSSGAKKGSNFALQQDVVSSVESEFDLDVNDDGVFVLVWIESRSSEGVYAQIYDSSAAPQGSNILVSDDPLSSPRDPKVSIDNDTFFVATWTDQRDGNPNIYFQRFYLDGTPVSSNMIIHNPENSLQVSSDNAVWNAYLYTVWMDNRSPGHGFDIYGIILGYGHCFECFAGWNLISLPLEPLSSDPDSVFGDDVSPYYLFGYGNCSYNIPTEVHSCGFGYWLGLLQSDTVCLAGSMCQPSQGPVCIFLDDCWNLIGCPYVTCVDWAKTEVCRRGECVPLSTAVSRGWVFDVLYWYSQGGYLIVPTLCADRGYWFPALADSCELCLYPDINLDNMLFASGEHPTSMKQRGKDDWLVELHVCRDDGACDLISAFGVSSLATDGFDPNYDLPKPPTPVFDTIVNSYVRLYFPHPEWNLTLGNDFTRDIRAPLKEGEKKLWNFRVESDCSNQKLKLRWGDLANRVPGDCRLKLIDLSNGNLEYDMSLVSNMLLSPVPGAQLRHLAIVATKALSEVSASSPAGFHLFQNYPNPFNPRTEIQYHLPKKSGVKLSIYNISGQLVRVLVDENQEAGTHTEG